VLAATLTEFGRPLVVGERPEPQGELVLPVLACGVCRSDLHIQAGRTSARVPVVPGHEVVVEDPELGPSLVYGAWGCGRCRFCRVGDEQLCPEGEMVGWSVDGGYAEQVAVAARRHLVSLGELDPVRAAPLADAGVTPYRAVKRAAPWLEDGGTALVVGAGGLGQFALQYVRLLGRPASVAALDPDEAKCARALALGADAVAHSDEWRGEARAVFDFVGTDESLALAARSVERDGVVVLVGEAGGTVPFGFGVLPDAVTLTSTILGSIPELREVVALAAAGGVEWLTEELPLARANEALDRLRAGDVEGRLVLVPSRCA
jgi:alcohol dehydrogenase, propanol-preferring